MHLIIDAHLDLAWNALSWNRDLTQSVDAIRQREKNMTDKPARGRSTVALPDMRHGGVAVCLGTLLARAKESVRPPGGFQRTDCDYATQDIASAMAQGQLAYYQGLERRGQIHFIRSAADLQAQWQSCHSALGLILAMEGADPIVEPQHAARWWDQGLRVVGLAHYGHGHYAMGTGEDGPLNARGIELLKVLDELGMILDLTHCAEPGFFQALDLFPGPILASHNNCRSLVPGDRQFSDEQLKLLIARGAVIGAAFDSWMLYPGWERGVTSREKVTLEDVANHIDYICQLAGNTSHVGIGSDLDGGFGTEQSPCDLDTIADLQKLEPILQRRGYDAGAVAAIFHGNWLRFFSEALPREAGDEDV